jgi:LPXTG-site transpeptidase (sortase) family protein
MRDDNRIHKYYSNEDPYLATLHIKKDRTKKPGKLIVFAVLLLTALVAEGFLLWASADSKISYSPNKSEVIVGVKPPAKNLAKKQDNPKETAPLLALSDMYLVVPKLYINAPIDPVGVTANGEMATSPSLQRIAWYKDGTKPGLLGSAVFAGHYGGPQQTGIFRTLDKLNEGDEIEVRTKNQQTTKYKVYKKATYEVSAVPLQDLFNKSDGKYLNLVTCVGNWNASTESYDKRLIVYAKTD